MRVVCSDDSWTASGHAAMSKLKLRGKGVGRHILRSWSISVPSQPDATTGSIATVEVAVRCLLRPRPRTCTAVQRRRYHERHGRRSGRISGGRHRGMPVGNADVRLDIAQLMDLIRPNKVGDGRVISEAVAQRNNPEGGRRRRSYPSPQRTGLKTCREVSAGAAQPISIGLCSCLQRDFPDEPSGLDAEGGKAKKKKRRAKNPAVATAVVQAAITFRLSNTFGSLDKRVTKKGRRRWWRPSGHQVRVAAALPRICLAIHSSTSVNRRPPLWATRPAFDRGFGDQERQRYAGAAERLTGTRRGRDARPALASKS